MMLRVLIADDDPLSRERLRQLLRAEPDVQIVAQCATGTETLRAIQHEIPDVILLDVCLPELDGFEVLQILPKDQVPSINFLTAHDRSALRACGRGGRIISPRESGPDPKTADPLRRAPMAGRLV